MQIGVHLTIAAILTCSPLWAQDPPVLSSTQVLIGTSLETDPPYIASIPASAIWDACVIDTNAPVHGVAIYAPSAGSGNWSFRLNESSPWEVAFPGGYADGVILLGPEGQISFQTQPQYSGNATIDLKAWDGTDGRVPGRYAVVDDPGVAGSSISAGTIWGDWHIISVNEGAPVCSVPPSMSGFSHVGCYLSGFEGEWSDPADAPWLPVSWKARWEVETAEDGIRTLSNHQRIRLDPSLLGLNIRVSATATDSEGAVATATSAWVTVTDNVAPTLDASGIQLATTAEDETSIMGAGLHVRCLPFIDDPDGAYSSVAIIGATGQGRWQVASALFAGDPPFADIPAVSAESPFAIGPRQSVPGGTQPDWIGTSDGGAPMIGVEMPLPAQLIRFVPDPGWHGTATLTVKAWDGWDLGTLATNAEGRLSADSCDVTWVVERINDLPECVAQPQCLGTPGPGAVLTTDLGTWIDDSPGNLTLSATWERLDDDGNVVESWPYAALTIGRELAGRRLRIRVDALDSDGSAVSAASAAETVPADGSPVCTSAPAVLGTCIVGSELGADAGSWTDDYDSDSIVLGLAWERLDGATITTVAFLPTITPTAGMAGDWIRLRVTAADTEGHVSVATTSWMTVAALPAEPSTTEEPAAADQADGCAPGAGLALLSLVLTAFSSLRRRRNSLQPR